MNVAQAYIDEFSRVIQNTDVIKLNGKVTDVVGLIIISIGPSVSLGEICSIIDKSGKKLCDAEVVGFRDGKVLSLALGEVENISPSCEVVASCHTFRMNISEKLLGRIIDGFGNPIDG